MRRSRGFTLAELAVAIVILALLLFGAMVPFSAQMEIRNTAETRRTMDTVMDAIVGFAIANGRLPCPADGSVPAGTAGAGTEQTSGNTCTGINSASCTAVMGALLPCPVLPWATLGVPETDAWGRRFSYRVAPAFADSAAAGTWVTSIGTTPASPASQAPSFPCIPSPAPAPPTSFALCTLGDIALFTRTVSASTTSGSALVAIVISHGKNGRGAWLTNGVRLPIPALAANTDEAANANGDKTATVNYAQRAFYSRNPTPAASSCVDPTPPGTPNAAPLCEFDDIVATISSSALIARMVAAGRLP